MKKISKYEYKQNLDSILTKIAKYNQPLTIKTEYGNIVLITEKDYYSLIGVVSHFYR